MAFPIPLSKFRKKLIGTPDEIFLGILEWNYKLEKHTVEEWFLLVQKIKQSR